MWFGISRQDALMTRLVTRQEWEAAPPLRPGFEPDMPVPLLVLHHEGADKAAPANPAAGKDRVRAIQRYHLHHPTVDYRDIAYTMLADPWAMYDGRDWRTAPGATKGHNAISKAVCATGDWSHREPPAALLEHLAAAAVRLWQLGAIDQPSYDGGHRDYVDTACPGDQLFARIPDINRRAAALAGGRTVATKRIAGADRHETCAMLAYTGWPTEDHQGGVVFIALTMSPDTDGLANVANRGPVLTVERDRLPDATAAALRRYRPAEVVAIGGTEPVPAAILEAARQAAEG